MFAIKKKKVTYLLAFIVSFFLWRWMGYPTSFNEAVFLVKLQSAISKKQQTINFADLMPGDWELVCLSHGYDAPLYLKEYGRTYPQAGAMQDSAWGLIFIEPDGSYTPVSGSCGDGVYIGGFKNAICLPRDQAILQQEPVTRCGSPQTKVQFTPIN